MLNGSSQCCLGTHQTGRQLHGVQTAVGSPNRERVWGGELRAGWWGRQRRRGQAQHRRIARSPAWHCCANTPHDWLHSYAALQSRRICAGAGGAVRIDKYRLRPTRHPPCLPPALRHPPSPPNRQAGLQRPGSATRRQRQLRSCKRWALLLAATSAQP